MTKSSDDYTEVVDPELDQDGPSSEIAKFLAEETADTLGDTVASYKQQIMDVLASESIDAVLTPLEAERLADYANQPMTVHAYTLNESDVEAGSFYVSLKVTLDQDGSPHVLNCGHQTVVAQCIALERLDGFPCHIFPQQSRKPNRHGTFMIRLHKVEN